GGRRRPPRPSETRARRTSPRRVLTATPPEVKVVRSPPPRAARMPPRPVIRRSSRDAPIAAEAAGVRAAGGRVNGAGEATRVAAEREPGMPIEKSATSTTAARHAQAPRIATPGPGPAPRVSPAGHAPLVERAIPVCIGPGDGTLERPGRRSAV